MVFGGNFDRTLWLMLCANKYRKEEIMEFIKELPYDLILKIRKSLVVYNKYLSGDTSINLEELEGKVATSSDMVYYYSFNCVCQSLSINSAILFDGKELDDISLTLYSVASDEYNDLRTFDYLSLGVFTDLFMSDIMNDELCTVDSNSVYYDLVKMPFGKLMIDTMDSFCERKSRLVDFSRIPTDYNLSDIANAKSMNNLVRKRDKNFK